MIDVKCKGCNRLLMKAATVEAAVKCPRCKMIFEYHVYSNNLYMTNSADPPELELLLQKEEPSVITNTESTETDNP